MIRIPLDLGWSPVVTFDQNATRVSVEHHRRRVVGCNSRYELGLIHIRKNFLRRHSCAAFDARQRDARPKQLEEAAPGDLVALQRAQVRLERFPPAVTHCLSPVASRARCERANVIALDECATFRDGVARRLPSHGGDVLSRADVFLRRHVTLKTPTHHQRRRLTQRHHEIDPAMASLAAVTLARVRDVTEVDEIRH